MCSLELSRTITIAYSKFVSITLLLSVFPQTDKTTLSHVQSQELLKTLEIMEDKLTDMTMSFEEHKV